MVVKKELISIDLPFDRDTKGTHVFSTKAEGALITNVYVKKGAFKESTPEMITLTVSA